MLLGPKNFSSINNCKMFYNLFTTYVLLPPKKLD